MQHAADRSNDWVLVVADRGSGELWRQYVVAQSDRLVVLVDHWSQSYLLAVDPDTGANRWKTDRPTAVNWSTPLGVQVGGKTELATIGTHHVRGYDAKNGKELWSVAGTHQQCIPSPVVFGDLLLACSGDNTLAIRLGGSGGDLTGSHIVWKNKKAAAFLPSPLVYEGNLYLPGGSAAMT